MKQMKLSVKMIGGYLIIALVAAIIGVIGITKIKTIDNAGREMYELNTQPLGVVGDSAIAFIKVRNNIRDVIIDKLLLNKDVNSYIDTIHSLHKEIDKSLPLIEKTLKSEEGRKEFATMKEYLAKFSPVEEKLLGLVKEGKKDEAMALMRGEAGALAKVIDASANKLFELNIAMAKKRADDNTATAKVATTLSLVITVIGVLLAVALGILLTRGVTKPINRVVEGLTAGADQVASASTQVSSASQSLAEGASEQAAGIEETSSSIEEMSSMTKQNAENANQANTLVTETGRVVDEANRSMTELTESMKEITIASEETAKIVKTIDEISFQTNLLALNAAVEAARAGEAGAGFAVVADEVRNLAMRAADAAKNTSNLIEGSVKKIKTGSDIVTKTNEAFSKVAVGSKKIGELVGEIAAASSEQAQGIDQINKAVSEMDKVVQKNAASAEESASAAEEMNAQAVVMKDFVGELVLLVEGKRINTSDVKATPKEERFANRHFSNGGRKVLPSPGRNEAKVPAKTHKIRPEQVIPMEGTDFKEF
jgi:methyl-accepting chemotaxis protein